MRLKRLEISGFKSFRDRVIFEFMPGITAIVGPNGCGKSNVVDALRWVMGEQHVRYIRGKKIDDVIFHGSEEASPVSLAEVHLILARGEDQSFPEPYDNFEEITISRKHFRDGESEYFINKIPCRLLDIREFFLGTGVGARTYSIVEQNSIGQLIEAKPEDRRLFMEEAAGISKYKARKESAAKKIESTKQNLARLNDIIREVKGQLNSLSRQAKRAEEFRALKNALKEGEITITVHSYRELKSEGEKRQALMEALNREITETSSYLTASEAQISHLKEKIAEEEAQFLHLQEELYQLKNDIRLQEQEIEHLQAKLRDTRSWIAQNHHYVEETKSRLGEMEKKEREITFRLHTSEHSLEEKKSALKDLEGALLQIRAEEAQSQAEMERVRAQYVNLAAEKARLKNEEHAIERMLETIGRQKEKDQRELARQHDLYGEVGQKLKEMEGALAREEEEFTTLEGEIEEAKKEEEGLRERLKTLDHEITSLKEALSGKSTRLKSLQEFHEGYAWCKGTTQAIMTSTKNTLQGLVALVADCLSVQAGYERAVESVLGEKLEYVVVRSMEDGLEAINYLKEAALGRGHFVPLELRPEGNGRSEKNLPREMDPLLKHVSAPTDFAPLVNLLLGDTFVVADLKEAVNFWSQNGFRGTLVTFEGDVVSPGGILSGGSHGDKERSLFKDKREMSELAQEIEKLSHFLKERQAARDEVSLTLQTCQEKVRKLTLRHHQVELQLNGRKKDREKITGEQQRIEQTIKTLKYNIKIKLQEEKELQEKQLSVKQEFLSLSAQEGAISQNLEALQRKANMLKLHREKLEEEITHGRIDLASLEEKRQAMLREKARLAEEAKSLTLNEEKLSREIKKAEGEIEKLEGELSKLKENVVTLYAALKNKEETLSQKKGQKEELVASLQQWEENLRAANKKWGELKSQHRDLEEERRNIHYQLDALEHTINERYGVSLSRMSLEFPLTQPEEIKAWEEKVQTTRAALENFGEVNLLAIDEYSALKERYDFLMTQAADLNQSIQSLQRTIAKINRLSKERFAQTFSAVNASFQKLFNRIFPGGRGELILLDESNLLETGIDIEIQMPGKRKQHISLLSGGEKAMVALSFILAFVLYRPTPFLVLDEVDAALDDSNIHLFATLIKDISSSSQVIMITHNKISMEAAHYLYGITMEKKGISKVISVSLD